MKTPTYQELLEEIELIKLSIKLEEDLEKRAVLESELLYTEEYMQHVCNGGEQDD